MLIFNVPQIALIDLLVVSICFWVLWRHGKLSFVHPATIYVFYHVLIVTWRLLVLSSGANMLFFYTNWPVTSEEIVRAAAIQDGVLIIMTIAWIKAAADDTKRNGPSSEIDSNISARLLSKNTIWIVTLISLPIALLGLYISVRFPGALDSRLELSDWSSSSYLTAPAAWLAFILLILIYYYGFRWILLLPLLAFTGLMAIQGYNRFRILIPLIMLISIYLDERQRKWPTFAFFITLVVLGGLFFPLKTIGNMVLQGESLQNIVDYTRDDIQKSFQGNSELILLDETASAMTLVDQSGQFYNGSTYLTIFASPIPRQWWPDKPRINEYLWQISDPSRPMSELGMVVGLTGEAYINFGYVGVIIVPALIAYWSARFCLSSARKDRFAVMHMAYLGTAPLMIQFYRDGITQALLLLLIHNTPIVLLILFHVIMPPKEGHRTRQTKKPLKYKGSYAAAQSKQNIIKTTTKSDSYNKTPLDR